MRSFDPLPLDCVPACLCLTIDWTLLLENFVAKWPCRLLSHFLLPFFTSLFLFFSLSPSLSLEFLSPYIFFSKHLFAALTAKLSANENVSTSKLGIRLISPVENVPLLSSIPPAGKRWNHRQHSQTSGLIEQKKHDGKTEERSTFRAPLCNGVCRQFFRRTYRI